jgi:hypothetical protein
MHHGTRLALDVLADVLLGGVVALVLLTLMG